MLLVYVLYCVLWLFYIFFKMANIVLNVAFSSNRLGHICC